MCVIESKYEIYDTFSIREKKHNKTITTFWARKQKKTKKKTEGTISTVLLLMCVDVVVFISISVCAKVKTKYDFYT